MARAGLAKVGTAVSAMAVSVMTGRLSVMAGAGMPVSVMTEWRSKEAGWLSVMTERLSVMTERLSVMTERLSVMTERLSVMTERLSEMTGCLSSSRH